MDGRDLLSKIGLNFDSMFACQWTQQCDGSLHYIVDLK